MRTPEHLQKGGGGNESIPDMLRRVVHGLQKKLEALGERPSTIGSDILGVDGTLTFTPNGDNGQKEK